MAITIDGTASAEFKRATAATLALTTANTDDILIVAICNDRLSNSVFASSISDTAGLRWNRRTRGSFADPNQYPPTAPYYSVTSPAYDNLEYWWAIAPAALPSDTITIHFPTVVNHGVAIAFGVSGADLIGPWDSNSSMPDFSSTGSGTPGLSGMSTNAASGISLLIGASWGHWWSDGSPPSGYDVIIEENYDSIGGDLWFTPSIIAAYKDFSAPLANESAAWSGFSNVNPWELIGDALLTFGEGGGTTGIPSRGRRVFMVS